MRGESQQHNLEGKNLLAVGGEGGRTRVSPLICFFSHLKEGEGRKKEMAILFHFGDKSPKSEGAAKKRLSAFLSERKGHSRKAATA